MSAGEPPAAGPNTPSPGIARARRVLSFNIDADQQVSGEAYTRRVRHPSTTPLTQMRLQLRSITPPELADVSKHEIISRFNEQGSEWFCGLVSSKTLKRIIRRSRNEDQEFLNLVASLKEALQQTKKCCREFITDAKNEFNQRSHTWWLVSQSGNAEAIKKGFMECVRELEQVMKWLDIALNLVNSFESGDDGEEAGY